MSFLSFTKVAALPATFKPSTVYLVPDAETGYLNIFVSDKKGEKIVATYSFDAMSEFVNNLIDSKIAAAFENIDVLAEKSYEFSSTTELVISHGFNTTKFKYSIVNSDGDEVYASRSGVTNDEFTVNFTEPEEGQIYVTFYK
jgi:hypothetical protein